MRKILYWFPRIVILIYSILMFVFALLSGSTNDGDMLKGTFTNIPNTIPWLILLGIVYIAWRWEKIGGWMLIGVSIVFMFFFNVWRHLEVFSIVVLPILFSGILFLIDDKSKRGKQN